MSRSLPHPHLPLIPANAGTQPRDLGFAGLELSKFIVANRTGLRPTNWVPAFAGMSGI